MDQSTIAWGRSPQAQEWKDAEAPSEFKTAACFSRLEFWAKGNGAIAWGQSPQAQEWKDAKAPSEFKTAACFSKLEF